MLYLKTTETCNLNCKHCFTSGINGPKIFWDKDKIVDWMHRFSSTLPSTDTIHCEFHGGEPFLVPVSDMQYVYDMCEDIPQHVSWGATSNLTFKLYDEHVRFIKDVLGNRIGTSWDPNIRFANQNQFMLWHNNVKHLLSVGVTVKLFVSVTKDTTDIEPIELLKWIKDLGVQEVVFERLTNNGSASLHPEIFPSNVNQDAWFLKMHEQSQEFGTRKWFENETLEIIYDKFESNFIAGGTFCRDCEEKIFTINADGSISGCPNAAPEFQFGSTEDDIISLINSPIRQENIACERNRNPICYSCEVFDVCGGDCHQLEWQGDICGAPKSLMKAMKGVRPKKIWVIKEI
jgi:radical SAM protein with 4Fe4S-binding SPASM domain